MGPIEINHAIARPHRRRVFVAIGLIWLTALGTLRLPIKSFGEWAHGSSSGEIETLMGRFRRMGTQLPPAGVFGYLGGPVHGPIAQSLKPGRLSLMQYALAPRMIER